MWLQLVKWLMTRWVFGFFTWNMIRKSLFCWFCARSNLSSILSIIFSIGTPSSSNPSFIYKGITYKHSWSMEEKNNSLLKNYENSLPFCASIATAAIIYLLIFFAQLIPLDLKNNPIKFHKIQKLIQDCVIYLPNTLK